MTKEEFDNHIGAYVIVDPDNGIAFDGTVLNTKSNGEFDFFVVVIYQFGFAFDVKPEFISMDS